MYIIYNCFYFLDPFPFVGSFVPLSMDASDSYDPDDQSGDMDFVWYCQKSSDDGNLLTSSDFIQKEKPSESTLVLN